MERFLEAEEDLFSRAGLPASIAHHFMQLCRSVIVERQYRERVEVENVIADLQRYVCETAELLEIAKRRGVLNGMVDVFSGLTIAAVNGGLLAPTSGLSGGFLTASMTAGSAIVSKGYDTVVRYF